MGIVSGCKTPDARVSGVLHEMSGDVTLGMKNPSSDETNALALVRLTQRASHALRYEGARRRRDDRPRTPCAMKFGLYFEQ